MKQCSKDEWWIFWGIIIIDAKAGVGGITHLYDKSPKVIKQLPGIDLTNTMKTYRVEQLIIFMPESFHGDDNTDQRNPVTALADGFNKN